LSFLNSLKMQREEKQLDMILETILNRLNDLKNSILAMIQKLETEYEFINWPTFLDNFALISSHLTGLTKILSHEIPPPLRSLTVLPLMLSPERDEALLQLTEGRISVFSHDLVPYYLRTKPYPTAETKIATYEQKPNNLATETAVKNVAQYMKVVSHVYDMITKAREEWEVESQQRSGVKQTSSMSDTLALVAAVGMGKGVAVNLPVGMPGQPQAPGPQGMMPPRPGVPPTMNPQMGKAPSSIKTNIKSGNQIHPYR